jgi:multimeric flavodoxin WrbA
VTNRLLERAAECDGFVFGTPVYYAHPSGRLLCVLDRAFYAGGDCFTHKPGAAVIVARRSGTTASYDVLNKYFGICQMPVVSSTYWNNAHGRTPGEAAMDDEGLQTMRNLGRNMAWMLKCIALGRENGIPAPQAEHDHFTHFIR